MESAHAASQEAEKGGHGHSKTVTVIVNTRPKEVEKGDLTFEEVVELAFDDPFSDPNLLYSVTYRRGHDDNPRGSLVAGQSVRVKEAMVFNVTPTTRS